MPLRPRRNRKPHGLELLNPLTDMVWLMMGVPNQRPDFSLLRTEADVVRFWTENRDELLAGWRRNHPGTRPRVWWIYDKPEPRPILGSVPHLADGGQRRFWDGREMRDCKPGDVIGRDPVFESEAHYLDRHNLLTLDEREALGALGDDDGEIIDWRSDFDIDAFTVMRGT